MTLSHKRTEEFNGGNPMKRSFRGETWRAWWVSAGFMALVFSLSGCPKMKDLLSAWSEPGDTRSDGNRYDTERRPSARVIIISADPDMAMPGDTITINCANILPVREGLSLEIAGKNRKLKLDPKVINATQLQFTVSPDFPPGLVYIKVWQKAGGHWFESLNEHPFFTPPRPGQIIARREIGEARVIYGFLGFGDRMVLELAQDSLVTMRLEALAIAKYDKYQLDVAPLGPPDLVLYIDEACASIENQPGICQPTDHNLTINGSIPGSYNEIMAGFEVSKGQLWFEVKASDGENSGTSDMQHGMYRLTIDVKTR
jgi:hypothetical protein